MIKSDYIIGVALLFMLLAHGTTQYLFAKYTSPEMNQEQVNAYIQIRESNPLAALALQFQKAKIMYSIAIAPAFVLGAYYFMRRKYINKDREVLEVFAFTAAVMFFLNFFNDTTYLMGFLLR